MLLVEQVTPGVEAVAGASLFGPLWGIPVMPVTGLGAPRAAGLKLHDAEAVELLQCLVAELIQPRRG